jgi:type IV pilus assembly protein PilP
MNMHNTSKQTRFGDRAVTGKRRTSRSMSADARYFAPASMLVLLLLLGGCTGGEYGDLEAYVQDVRARQKGHVEPLPEVKPYETFSYQAHALRDPFLPLVTVVEGLEAPDAGRKREALEHFDRDALKYVGQMQKQGHNWALVKAPDDTVYKVQVGNHLGRNHGEILAISTSDIVVEETVSDGAGGWTKRKAALKLVE